MGHNKMRNGLMDTIKFVVNRPYFFSRLPCHYRSAADGYVFFHEPSYDAVRCVYDSCAKYIREVTAFIRVCLQGNMMRLRSECALGEAAKGGNTEFGKLLRLYSALVSQLCNYLISMGNCSALFTCTWRPAIRPIYMYVPVAVRRFVCFSQANGRVQ